MFGGVTCYAEAALTDLVLLPLKTTSLRVHSRQKINNWNQLSSRENPTSGAYPQMAGESWTSLKESEFFHGVTFGGYLSFSAWGRGVCPSGGTGGPFIWESSPKKGTWHILASRRIEP